VIKTIVVPLDGSVLAEQALEPAHYLAHRLHATIEVVQVFEPEVETPFVSGAPPIDMRLDADLRNEALAYVESVAEREGRAGDVRMTAKLLEGDAVETLAAHLAALDHPLVVMTTHGRSGIGRVLLGSVTDALIRSATVPVLAIRVKKKAEAPVATRFGRVLVPIAGADFGTDIGERTSDVFGTKDVEYILLHAVIPAPLIPPVPDAAIVPPVLDLDAEEEAARNLLDALADPLRARGAHVRTRVVIDVDPAHAILDAVTDVSSDVISMATHGYRGIKRLVLGSVADNVLHHAPVPVLLVRPPESAELMDDEEAERATAS
jgi:nucleotide-binding universal stress UspA family protein